MKTSDTNTHSKKHAGRIGTLAITLAALAGAAQAETLHWTGAVDSNWRNAANWLEGRVPNTADTAVIQPGTSATINPATFCPCATLYVQAGASVVVLGQLYVYGGASIQGNMSIASQAAIFVHRDDVNLEGTITMWDGASIARYFNGAGVFTVQANGKIVIPSYDTKGARIGTSMTVRGTIDDQSGHDLILGTGGSDQTANNDYLVIQAGGRFNLSGGGDIIRSYYPGQGPAYLANDGLLYISGDSSKTVDIAAEVGLFSNGTVVVDGAHLQVRTLADINASGTLTQGSWFIRNGGLVNTSLQPMHWMNPGTLVQLDGVGSTWLGLETLAVNQGLVSVWNGATLGLVPPNGGVFDNLGYVEVGAGARLDVGGPTGQFRNEPAGTLDMYVDGAESASHAMVTGKSVFMGGTLIARINAPFDLTPGQAVTLLQAYDWTYGTFDTFLPLGSSYTVLARYDALTAEIVAACVADIDKDGSVDLNDFFAFFNAFDTGGADADLDGNPGVDLGDFFEFFNHWDVNC